MEREPVPVGIRDGERDVILPEIRRVAEDVDGEDPRRRLRRPRHAGAGLGERTLEDDAVDRSGSERDLGGDRRERDRLRTRADGRTEREARRRADRTDEGQVGERRDTIVGAGRGAGRRRCGGAARDARRHGHVVDRDTVARRVHDLDLRVDLSAHAVERGTGRGETSGGARARDEAQTHGVSGRQREGRVDGRAGDRAATATERERDAATGARGAAQAEVDEARPSTEHLDLGATDDKEAGARARAHRAGEVRDRVAARVAHLDDRLRRERTARRRAIGCGDHGDARGLAGTERDTLLRDAADGDGHGRVTPVVEHRGEGEVVGAGGTRERERAPAGRREGHDGGDRRAALVRRTGERQRRAGERPGSGSATRRLHGDGDLLPDTELHDVARRVADLDTGCEAERQP